MYPFDFKSEPLKDTVYTQFEDLIDRQTEDRGYKVTFIARKVHIGLARSLRKNCVVIQLAITL